MAHNFVSLLIDILLDVVVQKKLGQSWFFGFTTFWVSWLISFWALWLTTLWAFWFIYISEGCSSQNFGPVLVLWIYISLGQFVDKFLGLMAHNFCEPFDSYTFGRCSSKKFGPVLVLWIYNFLGQFVDNFLGLMAHNFWSFGFTTFWTLYFIFCPFMVHDSLRLMVHKPFGFYASWVKKLRP